MSAFRRWLADLFTFGLVRRLEAEIDAQQENLRRMEAGQPRTSFVEQDVFPERRPPTKRRRP